jgi:predicted phosphate transport protein (TIGR00153 family)
LRLIPRDEQFYELFSQIAERLTGSSKLLHEMFNNPGDMDRIVGEIKEIEHQADNLTHEVIQRLDRTFVTPFDREDIHQLASELDDVVDLVDGAARRAAIYRITEIPKGAVLLTDVLVRAADCVKVAVDGMKTPKIVNKQTESLKVYEEEGDAVYHEAMGILFDKSSDPIQVIKWKELYDKIEDAIDQCEDVGNVLQSISLKNA